MKDNKTKLISREGELILNRLDKFMKEVRCILKEQQDSSPLKKKIKKCTDLPFLTLFQFSFSIAGTTSFLLSSRLLSKLIWKVFKYDTQKLIDELDLISIREGIIYSTFILCSLYLLYLHLTQQEEQKQSDDDLLKILDACLSDASVSNLNEESKEIELPDAGLSDTYANDLNKESKEIELPDAELSDTYASELHELFKNIKLLGTLLSDASASDLNEESKKTEAPGTKLLDVDASKIRAIRRRMSI